MCLILHILKLTSKDSKKLLMVRFYLLLPRAVSVLCVHQKPQKCLCVTFTNQRQLALAGSTPEAKIGHSHNIPLSRQ